MRDKIEYAYAGTCAAISSRIAFQLTERTGLGVRILEQSREFARSVLRVRSEARFEGAISVCRFLRVPLPGASMFSITSGPFAIPVVRSVGFSRARRLSRTSRGPLKRTLRPFGKSLSAGPVQRGSISQFVAHAAVEQKPAHTSLPERVDRKGNGHQAQIEREA